jgi:Domain of unknown function (DUF1707)
MSTPEHRASDAEREAVADRLRAAAGDGRLDADELEDRLAAAYGARTRGELVPLTADLPEVPADREPAGESSLAVALRSPTLRRRLTGFLTANVVCWAIWLATGAESSVWPKWVLLGTGLAVVVTLIRVVVGPEEDEDELSR